MTESNHDSIPRRAYPKTQKEFKTENLKKRFHTQEPTQKEKLCRPESGKYRKITN